MSGRVDLNIMLKSQGEYKNDMIGLEFDPLQPGDPKLKGKVIINTVLGVSLDHSKWWDLAVVVIILIVYRLLFFTILKFKERASPLFRKLCTHRSRPIWFGIKGRGMLVRQQMGKRIPLNWYLVSEMLL